MVRTTVFLIPGLALVAATACSDVAGPRHAELPVDELPRLPSAPAVGTLLATPCDVGSWGPGLDHLRDRQDAVLVDLTFGRPREEGPHDAPSAEELALVASRGGTVVHRFQAPAVRARIALARVPELVSGEAWVTVRAVADSTRYDLGVEVDFGRVVGPAELQAFQALGGRVTERHPGLPLLGGIIPDDALPALRARVGAASVAPERIYCTVS